MYVTIKCSFARPSPWAHLIADGAPQSTRIRCRTSSRVLILIRQLDCQVLESWRTKRVIEPQKLEEVLSTLDSRRATASLPSASSTATSGPNTSPVVFDLQEIKKRMEEDRERHKRLRERRWVQPISHNLPTAVPPLASFLPLTDDGDGAGELTLDTEARRLESGHRWIFSGIEQSE